MQFTVNPFTHRLDAFEQTLPGGSQVEFLSGNVGGQIPADALHNINIIGAGPVTVTGVAGTNTLTISVAGMGITWTREALANVAMVSDHGYINANAGLTTFTLPAVAAVGSVIEIVGEGAGGWRVAQNAGQNIQYDIDSTTIGVGGFLNSGSQYNCVKLVCRVANTTFQVVSNIGVLTTT